MKVLTRMVLVVATVAGGLAVQRAGAEMMQHMFIGEPAYDLLIFDRWYITYHTREVIDNYPHLRRYWSFQAYRAPAEADRFNIKRGRLTIIGYDREELRDWRSREPDYGLQRYTPPPGGWGRLAGSTESIAVATVPTEDFLGTYPPPKETPYLRWMIMFRYPKGVEVEDGEKWYLEVHVPQLKTLPGLKRFVSYRSLEGTSQSWVRMSELWFDDIESWRAALIDSPPALTAPSWSSGTEMAGFIDMISTFVGEKPDRDFLNDKGRSP